MITSFETNTHSTMSTPKKPELPDPSAAYVKRSSLMYLRGFLSGIRSAAPTKEASIKAQKEVAEKADEFSKSATNRVLGSFALRDHAIDTAFA